MKKVLSLLLVCLCAISAWASDVVFDANVTKGQESQITSGKGDNVALDGVTIVCDYGAFGAGTAYRMGKNSNTTISCGTNITKIVFDCIDKIGSSSYGGDGFAAMNGMTVSEDTKTVTWIGNATEVTFVASGHQVRAKTITVTLDDGTTTLAAPTFSPAGGTYYEAQTVEISGPAGATIYYTTDGNDPTTSSAVYSAPIAVNQTTTIKAIADNGELTSAVASATYTINSIPSVANIAAYYALGEGAYASISNPVTVYYANDNYVWVKDETGLLLIFGQIAADKNYHNGDIIPGGFGGYLKNYNNLLEMTSNGTQTLFGFEDATAGEPVNPEVATTADVVEANFGHYVTVENATISDISGKNFTVNDAAGTAAGYNQFSGVSIPTDGATYNITGIISIFKTNVQFQPTAFEKVVNLDDLPKVDDIAGLLATDPETDVMFNNPVTAIYQSGNQLYINDASGFMLVYGHLDTQYTNGDQINGIAGNWKLYNGMSEMIPIVSTFTEATAGTPVEPETIAIEEIDQSMIHNYLRIENCTIDNNGIAESDLGRNFNLTDETGTMIMRLNFYEVTIGEDFDYDATYNVEGFLAYYKKSDGTVEQLQFYPNLIEKVGGEENPPVPGDVNGDGTVTAADVTMLYNIILSDDWTGVVNGDQNGDNEITAADVTAVYNILLGN